MSKYKSITAEFQIDQSYYEGELILKDDEFNVTTITATYGLDSDGIVEVYSAEFNACPGITIELDLKKDAIYKWIKKGCKLHYETLLLPPILPNYKNFENNGL